MHFTCRFHAHVQTLQNTGEELDTYLVKVGVALTSAFNSTISVPGSTISMIRLCITGSRVKNEPSGYNHLAAPVHCKYYSP